MLAKNLEELRIEEIAERYAEITKQIKELEAEKEELRKTLINSEKEKIRTRNGTIRIVTRKNAILDNEKIILTLSKQELIEVASISVSKFKKFSAGRLDISDYIIGYKETKEISVIEENIDSLQ